MRGSRIEKSGDIIEPGTEITRESFPPRSLQPAGRGNKCQNWLKEEIESDNITFSSGDLGPAWDPIELLAPS